jgi:hypothetical protein
MKIISKKTNIGFGIAAMALFSIGAQVSASQDVSGEQETVIVHFFDDRLCSVCKDTKNFFKSILDDYPKVELRIYPVSDTQKFSEVAREHGVEDYRLMAPTIFIEDNFFQFRDFTSRQEEMIIKAIKGEIIEEQDCCLIKIPFINIEIDLHDWPLLLKTVLLGSLDGFNICSIGALILVLSIVMILGSKKKMFFYGGLFIITGTTIYGVLVFIWGGLINVLIGHLAILRIIVGLAAFCGGIYFLKEFWRFFKYGPACQISDSALVKKATNKLREAFETPGRGVWLLAGSIMSFAAAITFVELPCSIGLPIAFTGILVEEGVSPGTSLLAYTLYILAYLFFYMLIELVIFTGAVLTKKIWFSGSKLITWVTFAGAVVLFYLAFYYLFS